MYYTIKSHGAPHIELYYTNKSHGTPHGVVLYH